MPQKAVADLYQRTSKYSEVPNKSVTFFILFWDFFLPKYMALLGPTFLFLLGKISRLRCFLRNEYQQIPTYTPLLRPTCLSIAKKTSHLHGY